MVLDVVCVRKGQVIKMKQLRNYTEESVKMYMDRWFKEADVCHCDSCYLDIMAIMLNQLAPKYVVTEKGALFAQMDDFEPQNRIDLMTTMTRAADLVKLNPRH